MRFRCSWRSPEYRHLPTLHLGASHHRRMLEAVPRLQPHQATATARRPSNDIVQPRSTLRAIAPVACIASSFIVSPVAKLSLRSTIARAPCSPRSTPSRSAPSSSRQAPMIGMTAPPVARPCDLAARSARFRGSRTSGFRLAGTSPIAFPSIPAPSRDFAAKSEPSRSSASPDSPGSANRALMASPGPSHRCRKVVPRSPNMLRLPRKSCYSASMRLGNTSLRMRLFTPVQAIACGSEREPPDRPLETVRYINDTRTYRASSCRHDRS